MSRPVLASALALAFSAGALSAQTSMVEGEESGRRFYASRYLELGHWSYPYLDLLVARGRLSGLAPLVEPYRRVDVAQSLLRAEREERLDPAEREWLDLLKGELAPEIDEIVRGRPQGLAFSGEVGAGFEAVTHTHRDPLRPDGPSRFFPTVSLGLDGEAPGVVGRLTLQWNNRYLNDPQFPGGAVIPKRACDPAIDECAYRVEEAYVEVQLPYVRVFFGRLYRNWGLPGRAGFLISSYAYSYDHIGYRFGSERIGLTGLFTSLNDFSGDTARYLSSHRFDWMIRDNLVLSVGESVIYGGENRRFDLTVLNPVGVWEISSGPPGEGGSVNALGLAELWWRPFARLLTYGAFMIDNTNVGDEGVDHGLNQYAWGIGAQLPAVRPNLGLRADLSVISSLAYRSRVAFFEYYAAGAPGFGVGLAQDRIDALVLSAMADWFVRPRLLLRPQLIVMRKGESDLTDPWPDDAFRGFPKLLSGRVETTVRPGVQGQWSMPHGSLRWDVGVNLIKNEGHVEKDWVAELVGRVLFAIGFRT